MDSTARIAATRAERLARTHAELTALLRQGLTAPAQPNPAGQRQVVLATAAASAGAGVVVQLAAGELHALLRAAIPPSASDWPSRRQHGLLCVAMDLARTAVCELRTQSVPPRAVAAVLLLSDQLRAWLSLNNVVAMRPGDRATDELRHRDRDPAALRRLARRDGKADITALLRPPVRGVPFRSHQDQEVHDAHPPAPSPAPAPRAARG